MRRERFCAHLADWLHATDWHFTTLLAVCIESVEHLPDDADALVDELLFAYKEKPGKARISEYLISRVRVDQWFKVTECWPRVVRFNLAAHGSDNRVASDPFLNTEAELAEWLGLSLEHLHWLTDLKRHDPQTPTWLTHYHYNLVNKRDGSLRLIESPKSRLKRVQRRILDEILTSARVHDSAHGFRKGRSCRTHAALHTCKNHVFQLDITHCFQSVQWLNVYRVFLELGYSPAVARSLTALCTHRICDRAALSQLDRNHVYRLRQRHLAQGAPTSPALANTVMYRLDTRLGGLAESLKLDYSRYADDLAFSGNQHRDWRFLETLIGSICLEEGFALNYHKTRVRGSHQKQLITGVVVNEKVNVDRRYYENLKAVLTNCVRHGLQSQNRSDHPDFRAHLYGRIQHVHSLNSIKGQKLERIFDRIG